ncbi:MAG: asparagine synthase (glutamine-hydrolyzing) [Candidatus Rifleibacteriota bacterium]
MCGIAGFVLLKSNLKNCQIRNRVIEMTSKIVHRGPDSHGTWEDEIIGIGLGHRRLSILDLSEAGHQPMLSPSGRYVIVLNGEIYNFTDLKRKVECFNGIEMKLRGHSDTEIFLNAVESLGVEDAVKMAVGMFSIALWDREKRVLTLARDRMGEKPLYYGTCPEGLVFASELSCFKGFIRKDWEIDRNALALFFRHNYIPAPHTIFKNVFKLEPGHMVSISVDCIDKLQNGVYPFPYWDIVKLAREGSQNNLNLSFEDCQEQLENLIKNSISLQMVADVPLGAFLSGGVDSSLIVGIMQSLSLRPIKTFTIGFNETNFNEAGYAKEVARYIGTDHTELYVTPKMALDIVPKLCKIYSEPFSDSSQIPTHLVCQLARKHVTVALSGDAGDELFGGYSRYFQQEKLWKVIKYLNKSLKQVASGSLQILSDAIEFLGARTPSSFSNLSAKALRAAEFLQYENSFQLYKSLVSHSRLPSKEVIFEGLEPVTKLDFVEKNVSLKNDFEKMMFCDMISYLPDDILVKVDRAAMSVSLETRVPLLDPAIVEFSFKIPIKYKVCNGKGKLLLRRILENYLPKNLFERPKMGFGIPIGDWLRNDLKDWAYELLKKQRIQREGYLCENSIDLYWKEHQSGRKARDYMLWNVLMFQSWLEEWNKK